MQRRSVLAPIIVLVISLLACASSASAWGGWGVGSGGWDRPAWNPIPYGYHLPYPSGYPLSYTDPTSGETYCLWQRGGLYYPCGYSAFPPTGSPSSMPPPPGPPFGSREVTPPSGVLLFQLPPDAEVTLDGAPVSLSRGLGILAVAPGQHRMILQVAGARTAHAINVNPHAILIVTPTAITPSSF